MASGSPILETALARMLVSAKTTAPQELDRHAVSREVRKAVP